MALKEDLERLEGPLTQIGVIYRRADGYILWDVEQDEPVGEDIIDAFDKFMKEADAIK
jgi:hypothetical protein